MPRTGERLRIAGRVWAILSSSVLAACAATTETFPAGDACVTHAFTVTDDFEGARRGRCTVVAADAVRLEIKREDEDVGNPSPWYAFAVTPRRAESAVVVLDYGNWSHRYVPKLSRDGERWTPLEATFMSASEDGRLLRLELDVGDTPLWVAAQELILPQNYDAWMRELSAASGTALRRLGGSIGGRPILALDSDTGARDVVLLVGRQHPPEVSGAIAMRAFVETLFADTPDARAFRSRFRVIAVPLLNPDGVAAGHWRHNLGGVDLNRDWGPFTQPETQSVAALLDRLDASGASIRTFVDFHSTDRNLFYTQTAGDTTEPANLTGTWFDRARAHLHAYEFTNEPRAPSQTPNGKNYMYRRYGIPSLTYEVGDETDRQVTADAARVFAEELMATLIGWHAASDASGQRRAAPTVPSLRGSAAPVQAPFSNATACTPPKYGSSWLSDTP